ncbi:MAG: glycosyl transferase [Oscillospiraceae bacterium]|nr:glycosyl transferase [Oscillospiraceae bacterium]
MKFGSFDDSSKEYIIDTPMTPLPWINYLGSRNFFSLISNTAGGYTFYKDAKLLRLTRYRYNNCPGDIGGRYYYICDGETVFAPGWQPIKTPLDRYRCRHGLGYTIFEAEKNGLAASLCCFVPRDDNCEINHLTLQNCTNQPKTVDVFSLREFCLYNTVDDATNFQRNFSIGEVEVENGIIYHKTEFRERRNHYAFFGVNRPPEGFDTARDAFCGPYNGFDCPEVVKNRKSTDSIAHGWAPIGSHHHKLILAPGEKTSLVYLLGFIQLPDEEKWERPGVINKSPAKAMLRRFDTAEKAEAALREIREYWNSLLSKFTISSPDRKLDRMVNIWNQYQCMVTFHMSRSASYYESGVGRGMGFRDSCQDLLGLVHLIPKLARKRILDIAATQFEDGSAYHQYQPLTKQGNLDVGSGFNDDPLWLIACTSAYLRETGDFSILDEQVPYDNDEAMATSLLEHLDRSCRYTVTHKGPHGLPLIGRADWNDCLNLNCFSTQPGESFQTCSNFESGKAESVFIAGMFVKYGRELADIHTALDNVQAASEILAEVQIMEDAVQQSGWDGQWFLRAYDAFEQPVGSHVCGEGKIFIEPQGICVMAGIGLQDGRARRALNSVRQYLDTPYGIVLLQPAYTKYYANLGEISSYPPGYKENAGIFCHNNPWISCANAVVGNGNEAFRIYKKTCPAYIEDISEIHRTEPYVYSQMIAGKDAPTFGEAKNSWLTGTAAWAFVSISQYILGILPELGGLSIRPCLPDELTGYHIRRVFRGAEYDIEVENHAGGNHITSFTVNGTPQADCLIPYDESIRHYDVTVVLG